MRLRVPQLKSGTELRFSSPPFPLWEGSWGVRFFSNFPPRAFTHRSDVGDDDLPPRPRRHQRAVDMGTTREFESRLQTRGTRLAPSKLADFESGAESLTAAANEGSFESSDDSDWSWTTQIDLQGPPNLYLVSVTVSRDYKGTQFKLTLSQMIYDPAYMGTAGEATRPDATGMEWSP